jgi:hydroxymethylglutaryl-CoA lyase
MNKQQVKIIECPRDAMQGLHHFIPTEVKVKYLNALLRAGFDAIDAGSFVSPKAIPQMRDTAEVFRQLDLKGTSTPLLAIVANQRGGEDAVQFDEVTYLGFPFSISEIFQKRNTNSTIEQSLITVDALQQLCVRSKKKLVVYISMAFGNPYGDPWNKDVAGEWVKKITDLGVNIISLADTVGLAEPADISYLFSNMIKDFTSIEIGAHLHCTAANWRSKAEAAYESGCRRFDAALKGYGGCPMADDELVGNLATENIVQYLSERNVTMNINREQFDYCLNLSSDVFSPIITT